MTEETKNIKDAPIQKETKSQTRKRIPLRTRNVLTAPERKGYKRRFVNDEGDRIQNFKNAGYSIVDVPTQVGDPKVGKPGQLGSSVSAHVGGGKRAVLMEISEEYYNEDYKAAQDKITAVENEMKRSSKNYGPDGLHGQVQIS